MGIITVKSLVGPVWKTTGFWEQRLLQPPNYDPVVNVALPIYLLTPKAVKQVHLNNEYLRGDNVAVVFKELHRAHAVIMVEVVNRSLAPLSSESN